MKKLIQFFAHVLLFISIIGILLPLTYYSTRTEDIEVLQKEHFDTERFGKGYIIKLSEEAKNLIYNRDYYYVKNDAGINIRFVAQGDDEYYGENYFLIKYKDIAYTNVNNTESTDTIEEIKTFIRNFSENNIEITNGNILTNKENLKRAFAEHYHMFEMTYYSKDEVTNATQNSLEKEVTIIEEVKDVDGEVVGLAEVTSDGIREINDYEVTDIREYTTHYVVVNDFEIYSNFKEELPEDYYGGYNLKFSNFLAQYEKQYTYMLPVSVIVFFVILIYFLFTIGKPDKETNEIKLNDVDKIYYEIILAVFSIIGMILFGIIYKLIYEEVYLKISGILVFLLVFAAIYVMLAILGITTIKRIKAKKMIDTSICLKLCRWCLNKTKFLIGYSFNFLRKLRNKILEILENRRLFVRLCIYLFFIGLIIVYLIGLFEAIGIILSGWFLVYILYRVYKYLNDVEKIEKHLKDIHEGKDIEDIDITSLEKNLRNIATYVNNISDGLDNLVEEQMKSERLKTELITNVSHDIKTPLTSIINYIDLLKKENLENEKAKEYLDVLDFKSQRLKKLIEDLVDASKASSGTIKLDLKKVNLIELMKQSIGEFEDKFSKKGLKIELKNNKEEIYILGDSKQLYRVIENTFSNIEKYALDNTRVYIDLKEDNDNVLLDIKNISKEELNISSEELMQRFVRGDKSRTTEGSGLGLSISKSLVELQKGKFDIIIDGDLFKVSMSFTKYHK